MPLHSFSVNCTDKKEWALPAMKRTKPKKKISNKLEKEVAKEPSPRWMHTGVALGSKMFIFGGCKDNLLLTNEAWAFDMSTS